MADNGATPNVRSMVSDPAFIGLPPAQQREALYKLTKDNTFSSLSDADTSSFISRMSPQPTVSHYTDPTQGLPTMGTYQPSFWDRVSGVFSPTIDRIQAGLHLTDTQAASPLGTISGALRAGGEQSATMPMAQALAKPRPGMMDTRLIAPERLMTPTEQQAHPIATGIGEFAGGMTTPENLLLMGTSGGLGALPGVAGKVVPRVVSGVFSAKMLRNAYSEVPDLRAAFDRGDASAAERIFTHIVLGATMAGLGITHAATGEPIPATEGPVKTSVYEAYRKVGQQFARLKSKSINLDSISTSATGLYNSIRQDLILHQETLRNDGTRTIQDAINADKAALMNTNRGSIPTAKVVGEAAKMLDATGYQMKPAERTLFNRAVNQPEMTLEEAKLLRTAVGRVAFGRSSVAPEAKAVFTTAYNELGEGMKGRITDLQGTSRPYEHYNNQMKASFELEEGIAGEMMESLQGQDRHAAMPKMEKFSDANLTELQEQMKKIGLNEQAARLEKSKEHANILSGAYDVANGRYMSGIYRLFMQNPRESWPGMLVMLAAHGMKMPFPLPQIAGAIVASGHIARLAGERAANVTQELKTSLPEEYFRTRTQAEAPETFTYRDPDEGWGAVKGGSGPGPTKGGSSAEPTAEEKTNTLALLRMAREGKLQKSSGPRDIAPNLRTLWQESAFGQKPGEDVGQKARKLAEALKGKNK